MPSQQKTGPQLRTDPVNSSECSGRWAEEGYGVAACGRWQAGEANATQHSQMPQTASREPLLSMAIVTRYFIPSPHVHMHSPVVP